MFRTILVPLDGSPLAEQALSLAMAVGKRNNAAIHLALVHGPDIRGTQYDQAISRAEQAYLNRTAVQIRESNGLGVTVNVIEEGPIALGLCGYADAVVSRPRRPKSLIHRRFVMNAVVSEQIQLLTLKARTAADLMTEHVVSISETAPLREAVAMLVDRGFSGAPVVNEAGRAVGVVSLSDIVVHDRNAVTYAQPAPEYYLRSDLRNAAGEDLSGFQVESVDRTLVGDVMTPTVCSVRPNAPVKEVIEEMILLHVHRLFVTDVDGVLVGVIAMTDVLKHLAE